MYRKTKGQNARFIQPERLALCAVGLRGRFPPAQAGCVSAGGFNSPRSTEAISPQAVAPASVECPWDEPRTGVGNPLSFWLCGPKKARAKRHATIAKLNANGSAE